MHVPARIEDSLSVGHFEPIGLRAVSEVNLDVAVVVDVSEYIVSRYGVAAVGELEQRHGGLVDDDWYFLIELLAYGEEVILDG